MQAKLQRLFDHKHHVPRSDLRALYAGERQALALMIRGQLASPDRVRAMNALTRAEPQAAKEPLVAVLRDRGEPKHLRAAAAVELARVGGGDVEDELIDSLDPDSAEILKIKVAAGLGRVGHKRATAVLQAMVQQGDAPLRQQARLALMLVELRRRGRTHLPVPAVHQLMRPRVDRGYAVAVSRVGAGVLEDVLEHVALDTWGLSLSDQHGYRFVCGRNRYVLLLGEDVLAGGLLASMRGSALTGVIAQYAEVDESWAVRFLLLTGPVEQGKEVRMSVYRTNGAMVLTGGLAGDGAFELVAVLDGANTPARVAGRVREDGFEFEAVESEGQVIGVAAPVAAKV